MRKLFFALLFAPIAALASGDELQLDSANIDPHDAVSIQRGKRREQQGKKQFFHDVTLSGSGLVLSIFVYQGINRKNKK